MGRQKKERPPRLRLLTLNVGLLKIRLGNLVLREQIAYPEDRCAKLPEALLSMKADVVLLQEVFHDEHLELLTRELSETYPFIIHSRPNRYHVRYHPGLVTLSRYPIERPRTVLFLDAPVDERIFACKGWLSCRIQNTPLGEILLYNAHPTSGGVYRSPHGMRLQMIRMNQLRQLSLAARKAKHPQTIIGGDLNCGPEISEVNFRYLESQGWDDSWELRRRPKRPRQNVTWWVGNPLTANEPHKTASPQRIDHFMLGRSMRGRIAVANARVVLHKPIVPTADGGIVTLSDHYGYRVVLEAQQNPIVDEKKKITV